MRYVNSAVYLNTYFLQTQWVCSVKTTFLIFGRLERVRPLLIIYYLKEWIGSSGTLEFYQIGL